MDPKDLGKSSVDELKQVISQIAPEYLTDRKDGRKVDEYRTQNKSPAIGKFVPAHLPGDSYVDRDRRKNLERAMDSNRNFSHKAFVSSNPPNDSKAKHGGWEGTFAQRHGGFPHMFEATCPEKSMRWLGKVENKTGNTMPMLVKFPSRSGPGFPGRNIGGGDPTYECEFNYDKVERLNRELKLGAGSGFRKPKNPDARPWITTQVHPGGFSGMSVYQEVDQPPAGRPVASRASLLVSRPEHGAPFVSAAAARRLPTETFGTYNYVGDEYVDNVHKRFTHMVEEQQRNRDSKRGVTKIVHPPFKVSGGIGTKTTPSIMFRRAK
jgi:hypothetical protein|eukprot:Tamp_19101.p1 GENE.Tamp_19101~~Tamp_19101.p1  ORF type:complete len:322 (+),score=74.17 Tamp_19101:3-968(+)